MARGTATSAMSLDEVGQLRLVILRAARVIRQRATAEITPSQLTVLVTVERHGPLTVGEIASRERMQAPSASRIVAALEERGLVTRQDDPGDRRVSRIVVAPPGQRLVDRHREEGRSWLADRITTLPSADVERLRRALPVLERLLEDAS